MHIISSKKYSIFTRSNGVQQKNIELCFNTETYVEKWRDSLTHQTTSKNTIKMHMICCKRTLYVSYGMLDNKKPLNNDLT